MTQAPEASRVRLLAWHGIFLKKGDCTLIDAVGAGNRWKDSNDSGFCSHPCSFIGLVRDFPEKG